MLTLRKILLQDRLFILLFIIVLIITTIRIIIPKHSLYNTSTNTLKGTIIIIHKKDDNYKIIVKGKEKVIINYYSKNNINLNIGDKIKVIGEFIIPSTNKDKYLFNYKKYLYRKNIFYIVKANKIIKLSNNKNIYYFIKNIIIKHIDNDPYLNTFLIGDKEYIDNKVIRSYQENGISHLFAISGMHITLLVGLISKILKRLSFREESIFKYTTIFLLIYLFLVGLSPSILRGVLFYIMFSLNNIYYFYIKKINLFLLIISISLLINPNFIFDIGFIYSYLISLSLIIMSKELSDDNYIISLLKVSLLSFFVSIPVTLYSFYQINILSIIYNLLFVPLISIIIFPLSLIVFIIKPLRPIYNLLIYLLENLSIFFSKIKIGKLIFIRLPFIVYIIYLILILIYIFKRKKLYIYIVIILLLIHFIIPYFDRSDYIKMIDVGQGDSFLLHSNNKNILIDTGSNAYIEGDIFYNTIYPTLKSSGIKKIDLMIITHGDRDHIGEAKTIIDNYKVKKIVINCNRINYLEKQIINKNTIIGYQGTYFNIGDFKLIQLNEDLEDENDSSQIYLVVYKNIKMLFTGDASIKAEELLLDNYDIGNIDILKVGHHGSNTSTSKELINEIKPKISLISVGKDNKYNHPNKEVIDILKDSKIYRTDKTGTITIKIKNNKLKIETVPIEK